MEQDLRPRHRSWMKKMWHGGSRASVMEKELGHPILAFTMACVLPEADCPLTVGLCERPLHSPSYYAASLRRRQRKEPGRMWADAQRMGGALLFHDTHHSSGRGFDEHSGGVCCHGNGQILPESAASGQEEKSGVQDWCCWGCCLVGPVILSADVPRVSVENQQSNSAQQMLQRSRQSQQTTMRQPPSPHQCVADVI